MERMVIKSSLIRSIGFDAEKKILEIEFLRNQRQDVRPVYQYPDFPQEKFDALMGTKLTPEQREKHSIGSHFLRFIKPNYPQGKFIKREEPLEAKTPEEKTAAEAKE